MENRTAKGSILDIMAIGVDPRLQDLKLANRLLETMIGLGRNKQFKFTYAITTHPKSKFLFKKHGCQVLAETDCRSFEF